MFVKSMVPCCDMTDTVYRNSVMGAMAVARGATGRYCAVMYFGPEYLRKHNIVPISYEEAIAKVQELGGEVDF